MIEEKKDLKPTTYRLDETTKEKFKQIANDINANQDDTLNILINAYYLQNKQAELSEHKADIDKFQAYITSIISMYTNALQSNHDTKELVKAEFNALLVSKDSLIADLQEKIKAVQQDKSEAIELTGTIQQENDTLKEQLEILTKTLQEKTERLEEQKETNLLLKNDLNMTKNDNNLLKEEYTRISEENSKIQEFQVQLTQLQQDKQNLIFEKKQLADEIIKQKNEFTKTITELEQDKIKAVEWAKKDVELAIKEEYSSQIEKYREEIYNLKSDIVKLSAKQSTRKSTTKKTAN